MLDIGVTGKIAEVTLVRNARPDDRARDTSRMWRLGTAGRAAVRRLARGLPLEALVLTSYEPEAVHTAEAIAGVRGGDVRVDERVREARRPHRWDDRYTERARRYVAGQRYLGWEPQEEVARRFDAGVQAGLETCDGAPLVIVNHGLALTLWLQSVGAVADVAGFWSSLTTPDAWSVGVRPAGETFQATELARIPI